MISYNEYKYLRQLFEIEKNLEIILSKYVKNIIFQYRGDKIYNNTNTNNVDLGVTGTNIDIGVTGTNIDIGGLILN